jgi:hypothetical protein
VRTTRSWPLLVLAAPAAVEVWSGWIGIAQKTGFGIVSPLPGIWPGLRVDTAITLPIGVEAYAAYAVRAWLSHDPGTSQRTRRFAKRSAICSFLLGMAGQIAYHLLNQAGAARAPWTITTIVSCLPVLVLAMGTTLAHMLRADSADHAGAADRSPVESQRSVTVSAGLQAPGTNGASIGDQDRTAASQDRPRSADHSGAGRRRTGAANPQPPVSAPMPPELDQMGSPLERILAAGQPVTRRALREHGVRGSNERLSQLVNHVNAELAHGSETPSSPATATQ